MSIDITKKTLFIVTLVVTSYCQDIYYTQKDFVFRPGYGVTFERVSRVVDVGGAGYYYHTWSLIPPNITIDQIDLLSCPGKGSGVIKNALIGVCNSMNKIISTTNLEIYERVRLAKIAFLQSFESIPNSNNASAIRDLKLEIEIIRQNVPQVKRAVPVFVIALGVVVVVAVAGFVASIFNGPSIHDMIQLQTASELLMKAAELDIEMIEHINSNLASVYQKIDERINTQFYLLQKTVDTLLEIQNKTRDIVTRFNERQEDIDSLLNDLVQMKRYHIGTLLPLIHTMRSISYNVQDIYEKWTVGMFVLLKGYIPHEIIPFKYMEELITNLNSQLSGTDLTLVSTIPSDYYRMKNILFTRFEHDRLLITLKVPLRRVSGGAMNLYRVHTFPVNLAAGTEQYNADLGHTLVDDLPSFFGISDNSETYVELTLQDYIACSNVLGGFQTCGSSVHAIKHGQVNPSCVYAIFNEITDEVKKKCTFSFSKQRVPGSARQLGRDDTFLMFADPEDTRWRISCPENQNTISFVEPCTLCRVRIPCLCSMTGKKFSIPKRIASCIQEPLDDKKPTVTYFHRNILPVIDFANETAVVNAHSYDERIDKLFPKINITPIKFEPSNLTNYLARDDVFRHNYFQIRNRTKQELPVYETTFQEAYIKSRDFSDLNFSYDTGFLNHLTNLAGAIFEGLGIKAFFAIISSPFIISYVACIFTLLACLLVFLPKIRHLFVNMYRFIKNYNKQKDLHEEQVSLLRFD